MKANLRKKCCRYLITFLSAIAVTAGLLIPAQIKAADSYDKDKKGSITINLDDVKLDDTVTNKEGVSVSVYQIASINHDRINISFDINSSLSSTGVDVNDITTSDFLLSTTKWSPSHRLHSLHPFRHRRCHISKRFSRRLLIYSWPVSFPCCTATGIFPC